MTLANPVSLGVATEDALNKQRQLWHDIACCVKKAERQRAENAVNEVYRACSAPLPHKIFWFDSPLQGAIAAALINELSTALDEKVPALTSVRADSALWSKVKDTSTAEWWHAVHHA